jgi:hypothetical protein
MSVHNLVVTPTNVQITLESNTGLAVSGLIGSAQTIDRGGMKWHAVLQYLNLRDANRAELMAQIAELRGQANRLRVSVYDNPARGNYGGVPLVNGGGQTGNSLNVDGAGTVTNWIRRGDYFSVEVNGEHELKIATANASSSAGAITLQFEPRLRASPVNNAQIYVQDGSLPRPQGVFLFAGQSNGWSSRPGAVSKITNLTLDLIEDVFVTQ